MTWWSEIGRQLRTSVPLLVVALTLVGAALALSLVAHVTTSISALDLIYDPVSVGRLPAYTGLLSHIGVLLWWAAASVCAFSALLLQRQTATTAARVRFLLASAALSALLALDDLFVLHEELATAMLGGNEEILFAGYALLTLLCFSWFRSVIGQTDVIILALALVSLGISTAIDVVAHWQGNDLIKGNDFVEESFKLLGIAWWLTYFTRICYVSITEAIRGDY